MKRLKKISSLLLAMIMMFSVFMPYMGTVIASGGADDLTGWEIGTGSGSTLTGNPTDGWKLSLKGSGVGEDNVNSYSTNINIAMLKVVLDMSTMDNGNRDFVLTFGDDVYGLGAWGNTKAFFTLKKMNNGGLQFSGHTGSATPGQVTIENYDFSTPVVLEFVKDSADKWQPAIDGTVYAVEGTDAFVSGMIEASPNKTVVGFMRNSSTAITIENIKFMEKPADLTGWTIGTGSASTLSGSPWTGWKLSLKGSGVGADNVNSYASSIEVSKLQVKLDMSTMDNGNRDFILTFGDDVYGLGAWGNTKAFFTLKKMNNGGLQFSGHTGSATPGQVTIENYDFSTPVVLEFVKDSADKWQPAINGTVYAVEGTDAFVKGMIETSSEKTVVGFMRNSATAITVENIQFGEKVTQTPENPSDTTGWVKGTSSTATITGDATNGWEIALTGVGSVAENFNSYSTGIAVDKLQVTMNLSTEADGNRDFFLSFGNKVEDIGAWDGTDTISFFQLRRTREGKLRFAGTDGSNLIGETTIAVDFTQPVTITFAKDASDKWQPAINGTTYAVDGVDAFVTKMLTDSPTETVVGLLRNNASNAVQIKNLKFSAKEAEVPAPTTEWVKGTSSTSTITGDATNGWEIALTGVGSVAENFNSYATGVAVDKLQVTMDLSTEADGNRDFFLSFGNKVEDIGAWDGTDTISFFQLRRTREGKLRFAGTDGSNLIGETTIAVDFTQPVTITFAKDASDKWQPAINGTTYAVDGVDAFVTKMLADSPTETIVGLLRNNTSNAVQIKNIKFGEKRTEQPENPENPENPIDPTGWVKGANSLSTITGTADDGWAVSVKGSGTGIENFNYYKTGIGVDTLQVTIDLSEEADGNRDFYISFGDRVDNIGSWDGTDTISFFQFRRTRDAMLRIAGTTGNQNISETYIDIDLSKPFVFEFLQDENKKWQPAINGTIYAVDYVDGFVKKMIADSPDETVVGLLRNNDTNAVEIKNIRFSEGENYEVPETSNWTVVGYDVSGDGDKLSFKGNGYASWKKPIDLTKTSLEAQFKPGNKGWVSLMVGDTPTIGATKVSTLVVPEAEGNAISFIFGRQNETDLRLSLYGTNEEGKKAEYLITLMKNFDFDATHEIRFVEKAGNYYLAIDGQILEWPNHDGDNKYITNALTDCLQAIEGEAYFRLCNDQVYGAEWGNPTFVEEPFTEAELFIDGDVTVSQNKNGLSAVGIGTMGINKKFDIKKDKLSVQFDTVEGNWIAMTFGDTASPMVNFFVGIGNEHNIMTILLARQKNNVLRISLLDQGQEKMFMALSHFDFDKTHTFSFVEHRGKYYLAIDDRMIEAVVHDGDDEVVTTWVTKCVKALSKSGAYVRFVSPYDTMEISNVRWNSMGSISLNGVTMKYSGSPATGDFTSAQPIVYAMVLSTSAIVAVGVQRYFKRRKEK